MNDYYLKKYLFRGFEHDEQFSIDVVKKEKEFNCDDICIYTPNMINDIVKILNCRNLKFCKDRIGYKLNFVQQNDDGYLYISDSVSLVKIKTDMKINVCLPDYLFYFANHNQCSVLVDKNTLETFITYNGYLIKIEKKDKLKKYFFNAFKSKFDFEKQEIENKKLEHPQVTNKDLLKKLYYRQDNFVIIKNEIIVKKLDNSFSDKFIFNLKFLEPYIKNKIDFKFVQIDNKKAYIVFNGKTDFIEFDGFMCQLYKI